MKPPKCAVKTVASITPMAVRVDSRTFKQAASLRRFGYRSIVVEGAPSGIEPDELPFELISVAADQPKTKSDRARASLAPAAQPGYVADATDAKCAEEISDEFLAASDELHASSGIPAASDRVPVTAGERMAETTWDFLRKYLFRPAVRRPVIVFRELVLWTRLAARLPLIVFRELMISEPLQFTRHLAQYLRRYVVNSHAALPDASLYYLHSFYQFPAVYWRCRFSKVPFVYDAHDFYSELEANATISGYWQRWVLPFERLVERLCVNRAAAVVTVNDGVAQLMRDRFGCEPIVIRNAHDTRLDTKVARTIRDTICIGNNDYLIVSVGNWKPGMAIDEVFSALAMLPEGYHLAFLGAGFPCYEAMAAKMGIAGRIHVLKPVAPNEVVPFIATANAAVILYYATSVDYLYSLPNRFFQPIAAGVPVLYPPLPEIRRLAERYGVGLMVDPKDPAAISAAMRRLAEEPGLAEGIKVNLLMAQEELSWQREEVEFGAIIEKLIGPPHGNQPSLYSPTVLPPERCLK